MRWKYNNETRKRNKKQNRTGQLCVLWKEGCTHIKWYWSERQEKPIENFCLERATAWKWNMDNRKDKRMRMLAFEVWCYERSLKISRIEHCTDDEVFQKAEQTGSLFKTLESRGARMIGYSLRHNRFFTRIVEGMVEGKNSIERLHWPVDEEYGLHIITWAKKKSRCAGITRRVAVDQPTGC